MSTAAVESPWNKHHSGIKRIMAELRDLHRNPSPDFIITNSSSSSSTNTKNDKNTKNDNNDNNDDNDESLFTIHFSVRGPPDSEYEGGVYHGKIILPENYPYKAPDIVLLTPNGRFELNKKICLSITSFHQESWSPSWGIRTMLIALVGFMPTKAEGAIGGLDCYSAAQRKKLARQSLAWKCAECGLDHATLPREFYQTHKSQTTTTATTAATNDRCTVIEKSEKSEKLEKLDENVSTDNEQEITAMIETRSNKAEIDASVPVEVEEVVQEEVQEVDIDGTNASNSTAAGSTTATVVDNSEQLTTVPAVATVEAVEASASVPLQVPANNNSATAQQTAATATATATAVDNKPTPKDTLPLVLTVVNVLIFLVLCMLSFLLVHRYAGTAHQTWEWFVDGWNEQDDGAGDYSMAEI